MTIMVNGSITKFPLPGPNREYAQIATLSFSVAAMCSWTNKSNISAVRSARSIERESGPRWLRSRLI